jgi:hypothetical protein
LTARKSATAVHVDVRGDAEVPLGEEAPIGQAGARPDVLVVDVASPHGEGVPEAGPVAEAKLPILVDVTAAVVGIRSP